MNKLINYFDRVANAHQGRYNAKNSWPDRAQMESRKTVTNWLSQQGVESVLDLGCGRGDLLRLLDNKRRRLSGVDLSPIMIRQARKNVKKAKFYLADITKPIPVGQHDAAVCLNTLHHLDRNKLNRTLTQMREKANKVIVIEIKNPWSVFSPIMWFDLKFLKKIPIFLHRPQKIISMTSKGDWQLIKREYIFKLPIISPYCLYEFQKNS